MRLEQIGFYTLSDERAQSVTCSSPLSRCELLLTGRCNYRCPYCRSVGGRDIETLEAENTIRLWAVERLRAIRFSGGEPTLHPALLRLVVLCKDLAIPRIALSTNGSAPLYLYLQLINAGVNDISVSLDACCAEDGDRMVGGVSGSWDVVVKTIRMLSPLVYITVGIVLTEANAHTARKTLNLAASLGVSDIRIIPAAQSGTVLPSVHVDQALLDHYPILRYRLNNLATGTPVRGLRQEDSPRCALVLDDMAVCHGHHYPCIIYLREGGASIGQVGLDMRSERKAWADSHNSAEDPICRNNCLDVCVAYNNTVAAFRGAKLKARRVK